MDDQILDAPLRQQKRLQYAGFWFRLAAVVVDALVLAPVNYMLISALFDVSYLLDAPLAVYIACILVGMVYYGGMESSGTQATLGKLALGIKVGDIHGREIDFPQALGRQVGKIFSAVLLIGFLMVLWDPKKQALHDRLARTYVFHA